MLYYEAMGHASDTSVAGMVADAIDTGAAGVDWLPACGLDDAGAAGLNVVAGGVRAAEHYAEYLKTGDEAALIEAKAQMAAGVAKGGVSLIPVVEYGNAAVMPATGESIQQHAANAAAQAVRDEAAQSEDAPQKAPYAETAAQIKMRELLKSADFDPGMLKYCAGGEAASDEVSPAGCAAPSTARTSQMAWNR